MNTEILRNRLDTVCSEIYAALKSVLESHGGKFYFVHECVDFSTLELYEMQSFSYSQSFKRYAVTRLMISESGLVEVYGIDADYDIQECGSYEDFEELDEVELVSVGGNDMLNILEMILDIAK